MDEYPLVIVMVHYDETLISVLTYAFQRLRNGRNYCAACSLRALILLDERFV